MKYIYLIITILLTILIIIGLTSTIINKSDIDLINDSNYKKFNEKDNEFDKNQTEYKVIFRDDFNNSKSAFYWHWETKLTSYSFNDGVVKLIIPKAYRFWYFNAEMFDKELPYLYKNMKVRIKVDPLMKGSRGWGFFNGNFKISNCNFAWFIYMKSSPFYPKNGFYAHCVGGNLKDQIYIKIEDYDITDWHEYEIKWSKESVDFYIDENIVAHVTKGIPQVNCRADIWIDNAVWIPIRTKTFLPRKYFLPIFNRISSQTTLYLDYVEINEFREID